MSSATSRLLRVFMTLMQMTWSRSSMWVFFCRSCEAFCGMSIAALARRSSRVSTVFCLDSRLSVIMPIILSLVLAGALTASRTDVALLTSILCLRSFSVCLNLSWK